jgi:hypothetical protein
MGFDPNRKADIFMTVEGPTDRAPRTAKESPVPKQAHFATSGSDADRIADAKARGMQLVKENNLPGAEYGFEYHASYFRDFCGPETSWYAASHLVFEAQLIEVKINGRLIPIGARDDYSPHAGDFTSLGF